ncbi:MAG: DUF3592 domain-containing protein [Pseudomonadota bacterium]
MRFFNVPYRLFMLGLITLLLPLMCAWIALVNLPLLEALEQRGKTTTAQIVWAGEPYWDWSGRASNSGGMRQVIRYGFHTEQGEWIERSVNRKVRYSRELTVGRTFDVTYLPDRPNVFHSTLFKGYAGVGMIKALLLLAGGTGLVTLYLALRMPQGWRGPRLRPVVSFGHTEHWESS